MTIVDKLVVYLVRIKLNALHITFVQFLEEIRIRLLLCACTGDAVRNKSIYKQCNQRQQYKCHNSLAATVVLATVIALTVAITAIIAIASRTIVVAGSVIVIIIIRSLIIHIFSDLFSICTHIIMHELYGFVTLVSL